MRTLAFGATVALLLVMLLAYSTPTDAQTNSTATAEATKGVEAYQTQVAEQEATIEALQTQVAQLEQRLETLSGTGARKTPTPKPGEEAAKYEVGESFEVDNWTVTVTSVEVAPTIDLSFEQKTARGVYVLTYMTIVNDGDSPAAFPYADLQIVAGDGKTYGFDSDSAIGFQIQVYGVSMYEDLQPGLAYETVATFDVPPAATGLSLTTSRKAFEVDLAI